MNAGVPAGAMRPLHYLDFDFSDEDSGRGSFDAMASVVATRLPALLAEIAAVLGWAGRTFGPAGALADDGEWDYALLAIDDSGAPLAIAHDAGRGVVSIAEAPAGQARTTVTLTLGGSAAFCDGLRETFGAGG